MLLASSLWPAPAAALVRASEPPRPAPRPVEVAGPRFSIAPYLQDVTRDGITVLWETEQPTTGVVRLKLQRRQAAFLSPPGTHHEVRLSGLRPGVRYGYEVAIRGLAPGTELRSEAAEFTTAPEAGPFTFLVYGDNRDRDADHAAVIKAMVPEAPDLVIQTGDMVGSAGDEILWRRYFHAAAPLLRSAAMYPALGNHELRGDPDARRFFRLFALPGEDPKNPPNPRTRAVYYSFRYSNALFIALDGNNPSDPGQVEFLSRTLAQARRDPSVRHSFAFVHQPPYAVGTYCGSVREQRALVPLLSRFRVRAVFGGHEHAYEHLERGGVRYFVSGGGGAPLYHRGEPCNEADQRALRMFRAEHHYLRVRVRGEEATLTAISRTGAVMEEVRLHDPIPDRLSEPEAESGPPLQRREAAPESPLELTALALPLALAAAVGAAAFSFWVARPFLARRRREDLLPGGEPPPRGASSGEDVDPHPRS